jgi:hypothetical protein
MMPCQPAVGDWRPWPKCPGFAGGNLRNGGETAAAGGNHRYALDVFSVYEVRRTNWSGHLTRSGASCASGALSRTVREMQMPNRATAS